MTDTHELRCKCGSLRGEILCQGTSNRALCYCADCQAFARYLGKPDQLLDSRGGTHVVQLAQTRLRFTQGKEHLAVMRLGPGGLMRWYANCCKTPVGNTLANPKISFIGLCEVALDDACIEADFGTDVAVVNVGSATGDPKPKQKGTLRALLRFAGILVPPLQGKRWKKTPLFDDAGEPVVAPKVLEEETVRELKRAP